MQVGQLAPTRFCCNLTRCKSVVVLICPLELRGKLNWALVASSPGSFLFLSSRQTLVSQASRREFVLHCTCYTESCKLETRTHLGRNSTVCDNAREVGSVFPQRKAAVSVSRTRGFVVGWAGAGQPLCWVGSGWNIYGTSVVSCCWKESDSSSLVKRVCWFTERTNEKKKKRLEIFSGVFQDFFF